MAFNAGGAAQGGFSGASAGSAFGPWGTAIGAVAGGLLGGFMGGGGKGKQGDAENFARQQLETQMQKAIQWRVADARAAGVHPLAALGAQVSASPATPIAGDSGGSNLGASLSDMGQSLTRAFGAFFDKEQKNKLSMQVLQIQGQEIDNQIKLEELKRLQGGPGSPPAFPNMAVGESHVPIGAVSDTRRYPDRSVSVLPLGPAGDAAGLRKAEPSEYFPVAPSQPGMQPIVNPESQWMRTNTGAIDRMPGKSWQMDDMGAPGYLTWQLRNSILPALPFGGRALPAPPKEYETKGQIGWFYKMGHGYVPVFPSDHAAQYSPWFVPLSPR